MSALTDLSKDINEYWKLPHHDNPKLAEKLSEVQDWQKNRIRDTQSDLFSEPRNQPIANYFLNNLYGGDTLDEIISQIEKVLPKAQKVEKIAPNAALETGVLGIRTAIKSTELDLAIAQWLLENEMQVNEKNMHDAYRTVDSASARHQQIKDLKQVCYGSDKYLKSFILQKAFKLTKNSAKKHDLLPLYNFVDSGFEAVKPLKSVGSFIEPFCERELEIIDRIHS